MDIRLSVSDRTNDTISRYHIQKVESIQQVVNFLLIPILTEKVGLVDALRVPKGTKFLRGMIEYNMMLASIFYKTEDIDALMIPMTRGPKADYHLAVSIDKDKPRIILSIFKLTGKGGIPIYYDSLRDFSKDKLMKV